MVSNLESLGQTGQFGKTGKLVSFYMEESSGSRTMTHAGASALHGIRKNSLLTGESSETSKTAYMNCIMAKN